ncbi:hypothetical protein [Clostridium manihotivorum]|uniref:Uncharacterized protein n=1 Tax=Clostridium manihotivorum TaxID=2320868 RepID=A0A3R5QRY5_9CLOT|nr:hypothetical protein [Clostridium manihotivorum]QAA31077.1 hypothetical protein C1I91_05025 [Clostridium manihotivorum]
MSNTKKLISLLLVICFSVSSMQIPVYAKDNKSNSGNVEKNTNASVVKNQKSKKITKELTNERTENSKKFQKEDGSFEVDQYNSAIHYQDGGQWKDIDNTLEESKDKDDDGNNVLENKQNNIKVKISKNSSSKKLVQMKKR